MKKALLTVIIALTATLGAWAGKPAKVVNLVNQYKDQEGFEVVSLGRLGTRLIKGVIKISTTDADPEDKQAIDAFTKIKRIMIVDFEDAEPSVKERFARKVERILDNMDLIMEASDDGERLTIYGIEDGSKVKDCMLYSSSGTLIMTEGGIDFDKVAQLMELDKQ